MIKSETKRHRIGKPMIKVLSFNIKGRKTAPAINGVKLGG
jgi:hypothetical protein